MAITLVIIILQYKSCVRFFVQYYVVNTNTTPICNRHNYWLEPTSLKMRKLLNEK